MKRNIFFTLIITVFMFVISFFLVFKECSDEELKEFKDVASKIYNQEYEIFTNNRINVNIPGSGNYIDVNCNNIFHLGRVKAFLENGNLEFDCQSGNQDRLIISIALALVAFILSLGWIKKYLE